MLNIIETVRRAMTPAAAPSAAIEPPSTASSLFDPAVWSVTDFSARAEHNAEVKALWRAFVKHSKPSAAQMAARNILLGRRPDKGFSPITNPVRLANGHAPYAGFSSAMWAIQNDPASWVPWSTLWCNATPKGWSDKLVTVWGHEHNKALLAHIQAQQTACKEAA